MFKRFLENNRRGYAEIAAQSRRYAISLLSPDEKKKVDSRFDNDELVNYVLTTYNPITCYLYKREAERKRLRMSEEVSTTRLFLDHPKYRKVVERALNLWYTQSTQYAIDISDYAVTEVFKEAGVEKVRWIAEDDEKTCKVCRALDGKIFPITDFPDKPHYNCRCYLVPYREPAEKP